MAQWRSMPAEPHKPRAGAQAAISLDQFDPAEIPFGSGFDDPPKSLLDSGPQESEYNHPDDYHADRKRYEARKAEGRKFVDRDRAQVKKVTRQRAEEQAAPLQAEQEEIDEAKAIRQERLHDKLRLGGAALLLGTGLLTTFPHETDVTQISKVSR